MKQQIEIIVPPEKIYEEGFLRYIASRKLGIRQEEITAIIPIRRSVDARKAPVFHLMVDVYVGEYPTKDKPRYIYNPVDGKKNVIIVGFGPSGMYAALRLIELGIKPIVLERGKDVQTRRRDLRSLQREQLVNPDSNYCFGEGGAGTYSDGKLYTRAVKRGNVPKVLQIFIQHGAHPDILVDTHPHIGSNKLPKIIAAVRQTILNAGGEIHYGSRVTDFIIKNNKLKGVVATNKEYLGDAVILAAGHSAKDIFYLLDKNKIKIEAKPFAMGVRIEHPQPLINEIQYHTKIKPENLPTANYSLSSNIDGAGVYSFCMCPGGLIVPAMTAPNEIVVNGMSMSKRDSPFANSGLVVEVKENEWANENDGSPFGALKLQQELEHHAFKLAGFSLSAPAQKATDFVEGKYSQTLPKTSYIPGVTSARLDEELPAFIVKRLKKALKDFNKRMWGYLTDQAVLVGVESRTSSPIRVPRDRETFMHVELNGLFPCGEGAGYAGGIVSSAIDGENCADAVSKYLL